MACGFRGLSLCLADSIVFKPIMKQKEHHGRKCMGKQRCLDHGSRKQREKERVQGSTLLFRDMPPVTSGSSAKPFFLKVHITT